MKESISEHGYRFEFFQAVRVLERIFRRREPVGRTAHPSKEIARFKAQLSLSFPASQIQGVEIDEGEDPQPSVTVNFLGLTGPLGVLPRHYTELLLERVSRKDTGLRDFLDIFNHRMVSLFYRAWEKYRFAVGYERGGDVFTDALSCLVGMGTPGLQKRMEIDDHGLLLYAGLLLPRPQSASGLEIMLADYFEVPVQVCMFHGRWISLSEENLTRLGVQCSRLGVNVVCGDRVWDRQSKFRMRIGPIGRAEFERFLPGGRDHGPLMDMVRLYAGLELDFDVQLLLRAAEVPACRLRSTGGGARLGWSSWLSTFGFTVDRADTVLHESAASLR
jgi:type VI secretion system protein ImpH